jgi:hypothetical protein
LCECLSFNFVILSEASALLFRSAPSPVGGRAVEGPLWPEAILALALPASIHSASIRR